MALEASEVAVRVRLIGGSAFQTEAAKVAGSTELIGKAGSKANETAAATALTLGAAGTKLQSVGNKMIGFGRSLTMVGVPLAAAGAYAMKTANVFNQQMTLLATNANENIRNIGWMSREVQNLSVQYGQNQTDMAKGLYAFESIGIHGKNALQDIKAAAMGSAVGLDSLANTADAVSTTMASKIKGAGGPIEAMSIMDKTIGLGKMHLADLNDSFKSAIVPMSQQFGITFPQIMAGIASLSGVGIPPALSANRMRLMLTSMVAPSTQGAKAMSIMHMDPQALQQDLQSPGGLPAALSDLLMHLSPFSKGNQDQLLAAMFGRSRGMGQILSMLSQVPKMESIYGQVMATTPATLEQHLAWTKQTPAFKTAQLHARLDNSLITLGQTLDTDVLPVMVRLVPYLTATIDGFSHLPKPLQTVALGLTGFAIVGGPLFMFGGAIIKGSGMIMSGVSALVGAQGMAALQVGITETAVSMAALVPVIGAVALALEVITAKHGPFADTRHAISHAGYKTGEGFLTLLSSFGLHSNALTKDHIRDYLGGSEFKHYSPLIRSDIEELMNPKSYQSHHLGQVYQDFAQFGKNVNLNDIPGISNAVKEAIREGMKEANISVFLPNGRILAQTVNEVNRKSQNRK